MNSRTYNMTLQNQCSHIAAVSKLWKVLIQWHRILNWIHGSSVFELRSVLFLFLFKCPLTSILAFSNTLHITTKSIFSVRPAGAAGMFLPGHFPGAWQIVTVTWTLEWRLYVRVRVCVCVDCVWLLEIEGQAGSSDPSELHLDCGGLSFRRAGPGWRSKLLFNRSYSQ